MRAFSDDARGHGLVKECLELLRALSSRRSHTDFYNIEVSHRGELAYAEDELKGGIKLSLGS